VARVGAAAFQAGVVVLAFFSADCLVAPELKFNFRKKPSQAGRETQTTNQKSKYENPREVVYKIT